MGTLNISQKKILPKRRDSQISSTNIIVLGGGGSAGGTSQGSAVEILGFPDGSGSTPSIFFRDDPDTGFFRPTNNTIGVAVDGSEQFRFGYNGAFYATDDIVGFSTYISDRRLKDNIKPLGKCIDIVKKLDGISYTYKLDNSKHFGLIAQDVELVLPEIIKEHELINDDKSKYKTIRYSEIIPFLIEAIKEQQKQIHQLELDLNYYKNSNT